MSVVLDCKRKVSLNEGGGLRMFDESVVFRWMLAFVKWKTNRKDVDTQLMNLFYLQVGKLLYRYTRTLCLFRDIGIIKICEYNR